MLYPKREKPLSPADFENPGSEYRAAPFWAWNNRLDKEELCRQIECLKELGYGGFHMHVRTGMATEYLSDEYMAIIGACVEKARNEGMLAWLYDEDRWPSGAAGGIVTKDPQYRARHLLLTRRPRSEGELLACFDIALNDDGSLRSYRRVGESEAVQGFETSGFRLYAHAESPVPDPWFNNQTYVDTLNPKAIGRFINVTHKRYSEGFQKDFGGLIPAVFTDEPQFSRKETLRFAHEDRDLTLPWTGDLPETYRAAYAGEDLVAGLPELVWDLPGGQVSVIRYHYHDHIAERFSAAFADQVGAWCTGRGIMLTGHMMEEPTLESQTHSLGEAMRSYRSFGLPGIDMLCDWREFTTAKQAQSAARQYGYPGVLSELYGVTNWDFDFRGHKLQGDWQAALGVTVRVPHLSWVSMNGEAKRDYPGTFNYQAPWYKEYPYVEDHFARTASILTRGRAVCRVGVIHPIESYWLHWGPRENTEAVRSAQDENFKNLCGWLLRGFIDFDYICESTLPDQCGISKILGAAFPVGEMNYEVVIVPAMETLRTGTMERLEAFRNAGGRVVFLGAPPKYRDAYPNDGPLKLWERSEHTGFDRLAVLEALEDRREVRIRDSSGAVSQEFLYQLREEEEAGARIRWLFICHADREKNRDMPRGDDYRLQIRGEWRPVRYDTLTGGATPLEAEAAGGWTSLTIRLWDHDSLLLKLEKSGGAVQGAVKAKAGAVQDRRAAARRFDGAVPVTLDEPNVLLLDIAEYALDNGAWREREEILRLDNVLRGELGWPQRGNSVAQPWVEHDASTPHTLRLRYTFESELPFSGAELALENAAAAITLNNEAAGPVKGWYVDKCIGKVKLPDIKKGTNVLELRLPYGKKVDIEVCYLLGDFGVRVSGSYGILTAPVRALAFGDITRQGLPFYGGNLTYHLEAESRGGSLVIEASSYRFMLLKVSVDGVDRGVIAYAPYELAVDGLADGNHRVDLRGYGCRINTFGQLHNFQGHEGYWWGPDSWRTEGPGWGYEYHFWPQGVLKSPEIRLP